MGRWAQARRRGTSAPPALPLVPFSILALIDIGAGACRAIWQLDVVPLDVTVTLLSVATGNTVQGPVDKGSVQVGSHDFTGVTSGLNVVCRVHATAPGFAPTDALTNTLIVS